MERDELARRYREAQLHAMATAAEHQPAEDTQQGTKQDTTPTLAETFAHYMRVKPQEDIGPSMTENERFRRWAGLK